MDAAFSGWLADLESRHLADLRFAEVRRGLQALSSLYVERRDRIAAGKVFDGAGKRAAFALFYGPLHFLVAREVARALAVAAWKPRRLLDLGCGTGAAGAAVALEAGGRIAIAASDGNPWAVAEAVRTYRQLGLAARVRQADLDADLARPDTAAGTLVLCAFVINELDAARRDRLQRRLLEAAAAGAGILVIEPLARGATPWWPEWDRAFAAAGGRAGEWRFAPRLPELIARLDRAAGLDHRTLGARTLSILPAPLQPAPPLG